MAQDAADHTRLFDERDQPQTPPHRGQASTPHPTAHNTRGGDPGSKPKLRSINSAHSRFVRGYADAGALSGFARVRVMSSQYSAAWRRKNGWLTNHGVVSYTNTDSSRANVGMYPTFRRLSSAAHRSRPPGANANSQQAQAIKQARAQASRNVKILADAGVPSYLRRAQRLSISHETIYRHIWTDLRRGGTLHQHLRGARKQRRKRYGAYDSRGRLAGKRHISERPISIEGRRAIGHWEIDTVMGTSPDCLVSLVECKTGYVLIGKLEARTQAALTDRTVRLTRPHARRVRTITAGNGTEFHDDKTIERATGVRFYFAMPYHAWERGTCENTNGLIRHYVAKGTSMAALTQAGCERIAETLNTRPRKRLGYRTPQECFDA